MEKIKAEIYRKTDEMRMRNLMGIMTLTDRISIESYRHLVREGKNGEDTVEIWTDAFNAALRDHQTVAIPGGDIPYYIDGTIIVPSNRCIVCEEDTVIRQTIGTEIILMRNENAADGSNMPVVRGNEDVNISILGGHWEESYTSRLGYRKSGKYDNTETFMGVSTLMFFSNVKGLTVRDVTFANTAGFSLQAGDAEDMWFERIRFLNCFADGLHINGNTENILIRDVKGHVGDDIVALNMYDWKNSSVNFGPMRTVLCEDVELDEASGYKAFRVQPGQYKFADGSVVDCTAEDIIIKNVRGMISYKLYFQTPAYKIGVEEPEWGGVGSGKNLFFEDITVDLAHPIDRFDGYENSDPVRGNMGVFEIGANIQNISFENINVTLHYDKYPMSYLLTVGPKSSLIGDRLETEVFDPYLSSSVGNVVLKDITVNGKKVTDHSDIVKTVKFSDINSDGRSTGEGIIENISVC